MEDELALALRRRLERILRVLDVEDTQHDKAWMEPGSVYTKRLWNIRDRYDGGKYEPEATDS